MDLAPVVSRLQAQVAAFRLVAGAADLASATDDLKQVPAAYVYPVADRTTRSGGLGYVAHEVQARFGVVIAARNLRDARGEKAIGDLEPLRLAVRTALLGWLPATGYDRCTWQGGRLIRIAQAVLWWQDDYETAYSVKG